MQENQLLKIENSKKFKENEFLKSSMNENFDLSKIDSTNEETIKLKRTIKVYSLIC